MSGYALLVFLHIVGALGMFAALGLEWAGLSNLRRAATVGQARDWLRLLGSVRRVGFPAMLTLLVTGIAMTATRWGAQGWISVGMVGLVLIAVLGAVLSGRRMGAIARAVATEEGPVSPALGSRLRDRVLVVSAWLRTTLALGIVFVMSTKPAASGALTAMGVALALGLVAGFPTWSRGRRTEAYQPRADAEQRLTRAGS